MADSRGEWDRGTEDEEQNRDESRGEVWAGIEVCALSVVESVTRKHREASGSLPDWSHNVAGVWECG